MSERSGLVEGSKAPKTLDGTINVKRFTVHYCCLNLNICSQEIRVKVESGGKTLDVAATMTAKDRCGGYRKWRASHLHDETKNGLNKTAIKTLFNDQLVPLSKATLSAKMPWEDLTVKDVQSTLNTIYGIDCGFLVQEGDVWMGLVRLFL